MFKYQINIFPVTYFRIIKNKIIILGKEGDNFKLYNSESYIQENEIEGAFGGGIYLINNHILDDDLQGFNFEDLSKITLFNNENIVLFNENFLITKKVNYKNREVKYYLNDIDSFTRQKELFIEHPILILNDYLICREEKISVYDLIHEVFLWQADVSKIGSYTDSDGQHQGEIKQIYNYQNQVIVSITRGVVSYNIESGEIHWHVTFKDFNPNELHISGNKAYLAMGVYYAVIDLDKGEKLLETNLGENVSINNILLPRVSSRPDITLCNNKVWHLDRQDNHYFLFSHEPDTGKIIDKQLLPELNNSCHTPRFHHDRMYILDSNNLLHIYQQD